MPVAIVGVVAAVAAAGATALIGGIAGTIIGGLVFAGIQAAGAALFGVEKPAGEFQPGPTSIVRGGAEPYQVIYGQTRVSGVLVYVTTSNVPGGDLNERLHLVVVLAGHEVEEIGTIWLNDNPIYAEDIEDGTGLVFSDIWTNPQNSTQSAVRVRKYLGTDSQAADSFLMDEVEDWTADHRLRGLAYVAFTLFYSRNHFPSGIPNVTALVKGRKVYDPRDTSTAYSNNWALCLRDFITADFGINVPEDEINDTSFIAAANVADEAVATSAESPTESQARYTLDGVFTVDSAPLSVIENMLSAGAGILTDQQGEYHLYAGAYRTPTVSIDQDDIIDLKVRPGPPRSDRFNRVSGTFIDPDADYAETDFPVVENSTYELQDGEQLTRNISLPFTNNNIRAQRIAKIHLEKSRQGITVEMSCTFAALPVVVGEPITLTIDDMGWSSKVFMPLSRTLTSDGVTLLLQEEASAAYDWSHGDATTYDAAPNTNLPDWKTVTPPSGLTVESGTNALLTTGAGTVVSRIHVSWTGAGDVYTRGYEIAWNKSSESGEIELSATLTTDTLEYYITPVEDGEDYDIRVRAINFADARSVWVEELSHTVVGKTEAPSDVDTFTVDTLTDGTRFFEWTHDPVPADVRTGGGYEIRYYLGATSDWSAMTALHTGTLSASPYETTQLAAGVYTFAIKAVDSSDNESDNAQFASAVTLDDPPFRNVLLNRLESSKAWPGTLTDCYIEGSDNALHATSSEAWSDLPGAWSSLPSTWATIVANNSPITYESPVIDLDADTTFSPLITVSGTGAATVTIRYSTNAEGPVDEASPDEPYAAVPTGEITCRYFQFKVEMADATEAIITEIQTIFDSEGKVDRYPDVNTASETSSWFTSLAAGHFQIRSRSGELVSITQASITAIQNVGPGYSWELISKSADSGEPAAEFKVYNGSDTLADATVDIELRGPKE